jgi:hypothetical protein
VKGFAPLPNADAIARAVAQYEADERAGFIERTNVMVSTKRRNVAWVGYLPLDPRDTAATFENQRGKFPFPIPTGVIQAQLVWNTSADLDLYLTLPNGQVVSFANVSVTFNNGRAIARLDRDNLGNKIDFPPSTRVENIIVNGIPLSGLYTFIVNNFNSPNGSDAFTLRVFFNGQMQVLTGTLAGGQNSQPIIVRVPRP